MKNLTRRLTNVLLLVCAAAACGVALTNTRSDEPPEGGGAKWIADPDDNICGLGDLRLVSYPARVDYERLLRATPEMRRIDREHIDPKSPLGVVLRAAAVDRILRACELVRVERKHCSVWKAIRSTSGAPIVERSEEVLVHIANPIETAPAPFALPPPKR